MKTLIALVVLVLVVVLATIWRKSAKAKPAKNILVEQEKPQASVDKHPDIQPDTSDRQTGISAVERKISGSAENQRQAPEQVFASRPVEPQNKLPEDSVLRRHFLSARQADMDAITNPYPTDSTLRRHYDSLRTAELNAAFATGNEQDVKKLIIPEDSTLRRHFFTQVQAEIESVLFPRPTDSTLRRHYESQVKARIEEYLTEYAL